MADVAAAAMVSPATFFVYFPSKEDVVFADHGARTEAVSELLRSPGRDENCRSRLHRALTGMLTIGLGDVWDEDLHRRRGAVVLASPVLRAAAVRRLFESVQVWADDLSTVDSALTPFGARTLIGGAVGSCIAAAFGADAGEESVLVLVRKALDAALG